MDIKVLTCTILLLGLWDAEGRSFVTLIPEVEKDSQFVDSLNDKSPLTAQSVDSGPTVHNSHPSGVQHPHSGGGRGPIQHPHSGGGRVPIQHPHSGGVRGPIQHPHQSGIQHSHSGGGNRHSHVPSKQYGYNQQGGWPHRNQINRPWGVPNSFTSPVHSLNQPSIASLPRNPNQPETPYPQNSIEPGSSFTQNTNQPGVSFQNPTQPVASFPQNTNQPGVSVLQIPNKTGTSFSKTPNLSGSTNGNNTSRLQSWFNYSPKAPPQSPSFPFRPTQPWLRLPSPPLQPSVPTALPQQVPYTSLPPNKAPKPGIPNKTPARVHYYPHPPFNLNPSPLESSLPREECITYKGELGECASYQQCGLQGGIPSGMCHLGHDISAHARSCCIFPSYCGYETNKEVTYFKNPNYPNVTTNVTNCLYRVNLLTGVCQVRVDFLDLSMKPMIHGECDPSNLLRISSNDRHAHIPLNTFCGTVANDVRDPLRTDIPHIYAHVDDDLALDRPTFQVPNHDQKSVTFQFKVTDYMTRWNIRISQIQCDGANLQAAQGCAQFYNQNKGTITSINLDDGSYPNSLYMSVCILRDPSACAIHYKLKTFGVGPTKRGRDGKQSLGYGLICDDYVVFNGEKTCMCGGINKAKDIILPVRGPQGFTVRSDARHIPQADVGYHVEYAYLHNCTDTVFYKYPSAMKN